jgi:hypothetical protein
MAVVVEVDLDREVLVVVMVDLEREVLVVLVVMFGYIYFILFDKPMALLCIRYVPEKHFCHMLFVLENDIINEENIIKVCMPVWVLAQVIMLEVT